MSRPKVNSKKYSLAMMAGEARGVFIMECGWCGNDIEAEADTEHEAQKAFIEQGVRCVDTDDVCAMMCPDCVELARKNKLDHDE